MDEIAYNAINTDASSQIDILFDEAANKSTPKHDWNKVENSVINNSANIWDHSKVKARLSSYVLESILNGKVFIYELKEDSNEFCSVVGNDNKMGADVKGKPFVRF